MQRTLTTENIGLTYWVFYEWLAEHNHSVSCMVYWPQSQGLCSHSRTFSTVQHTLWEVGLLLWPFAILACLHNGASYLPRRGSTVCCSYMLWSITNISDRCRSSIGIRTPAREHCINTISPIQCVISPTTVLAYADTSQWRRAVSYEVVVYLNRSLSVLFNNYQILSERVCAVPPFRNR